MLWFGPKAPCSNCGESVRKPRDPARYLCPHCTHPGPWATPEQTHDWQARQDAQEKYKLLLHEATSTSSDLGVTVSALRAIEPLTGYGAQELSKFAATTFEGLCRSMLTDDVLTREGDRRLGATLEALGLTWNGFLAERPGLRHSLIIASANGGLLPELATHQLITKDGEAVHLEWPAALMKEVAVREFQGGYSGFSFPIGKTGIRYRIGGARGRSVLIGMKIEAADTGTLSLSSHRAVFMGMRKTIELPYAKLVNLEVFTDGVRFHQSNRQTVTQLSCSDGEVVAAIIHAAMQRGDERKTSA